jgi:hypothetical protein
MAMALTTSGCLKNEHEQAIANGAKKLSKAEAEEQLTDHTLAGSIPHLNIDFSLYYAPGGRLLGAISGAMRGRDRGSWRVTDDGTVCLRWAQWEENEEKCRELWKEGDELKLFEEKAGKMVSVARATSGNTQKLELKSDLELVQAKATLEPVTAAALRSLLPGNTVTGRAPAMKSSQVHAFYGTDNRVAFDAPEAVIKDKGTYRIADDGKLCVTWGYLQGAHEVCESWFKSDKGYQVFDAFGSLALLGAIESGNPHGLGQ